MSTDHAVSVNTSSDEDSEVSPGFRRLSREEMIWTKQFGLETGLRIANDLDRFSVRRSSTRGSDPRRSFHEVQEAFSSMKGAPAIHVVREIPISQLSDSLIADHQMFGKWMYHRCTFSFALLRIPIRIDGTMYMYRYRQKIASMNVQFHLWESFTKTLLSIIACHLAMNNERLKQKAEACLADTIIPANLWILLDGIIPLGFSSSRPNQFTCLSFSSDLNE